MRKTVGASRVILPKRRSTPKPPAVYRPGPAPQVLQRKSAPQPQQKTQNSHGQTVGPPVYRPQAKKVVQPKIASASRATPAAPPAYRPNAKASQPKLTPRQHATTPTKGVVLRQTNSPAATTPPARATPPPRHAGTANNSVVQRALALADRPWEEVEELEATFGRDNVRRGLLNRIPPRGHAIREHVIPRSLSLPQPASARRIILPTISLSDLQPLRTTGDNVRDWGLYGEFVMVKQILALSGISDHHIEAILEDFGEAGLRSLLEQFRKVDQEYRSMAEPALPLDWINDKLKSSKHLSSGWFSSYFKIPLTKVNSRAQSPHTYLHTAHRARMQLLQDTGSSFSDAESLAISGAMFLKDVFREYGITIPVHGGQKRVEIMITPTFVHTAIHEAIHLNARNAFKEMFGKSLNEGLTEWLASQICEEFQVKTIKVYEIEVRVIDALVNIGCIKELKEALFNGKCHDLKAKLVKVLGKDVAVLFINAAFQDDMSAAIKVLNDFFQKALK